MRTIILSFLIASTLVAGCSDVETVENKDESGVLLEKYTRKKDTYAKHGAYVAYYPDGQVREESTYKNDVLDGERKVYYENGKTDYIENYDNGQFDGLYQKYFENGNLSNEGEYVDNKMAGIWKRWYQTGELREEVNFSDNEENGPFKEYHPNGNLRTTGSYENGENEQGELIKYDENGSIIEKMYCIYGVCNTSWRAGEGELPVDTARIKKLADIKKQAGLNR